MSVVQTPNFAIPQDEVARNKIKSALQEISDSFTRISAERDMIKDVVDSISQQYNLPKKYVNKMARTFHKQNFANIVAENEQLEILYETVVGK